MSPVDPTLTAMRAASDHVRAANHAAYNAPRDTSSIYDRIGTLHELLTRADQAVRMLAEQATDVGKLPNLRSSTADAGHLAGEAAADLLRASSLITGAAQDVNDAWSDWSPLYLDNQDNQ